MAASKKRRYQARETGTSRGAIRRVLKNLRSRRILIKYIVNFPLAPPSHSSPRKVDLPVDQKPAGLCGEKKGSLLRSEVNGDVNLPIPPTPNAVAGGCRSSAPSKPVAGGCRSSAKGHATKDKAELQQAPATPATPPQRQNPLCASVPPHLCVEKEARHA